MEASIGRACAPWASGHAADAASALGASDGLPGHPPRPRAPPPRPRRWTRRRAATKRFGLGRPHAICLPLDCTHGANLEVGPKWTGMDQHRSKLGRIRVDVDRKWAETGRHRPKSGQVGRIGAKFDHHWVNVDRIDQCCAEVHPIRPDAGQSWP